MAKVTGDTRSVRNSVGRFCFVGISLILQIVWLISAGSRMFAGIPYINAAIELLSIISVIAIFSQNRSSASKMSWIVLILFFPVLGLGLFLTVGQPWATKTMRRRFENSGRRLSDLLPRNDRAMQAVEMEDAGAQAQIRYLQDWCRFPVYQNTQVQFHAQTDAAFEALKAELKGARRFIFMEYHAIELSQCFLEIEAILAERAKAGVEVRLFYDDVGSFAFINPQFVKRMKALGIQCQVFNPLIPVANAFMNNRDHRKITVIDGEVGFTGGYNLADEYFNVKHPYGHWKDTGVLLRGEAVRSLTLIFLEMWNAVKVMDEDYGKYIQPASANIAADGYVLPYADSPLDDERVGENVYLNLLKNARSYAWITTPYLILDEEMTMELTLAAKRGVDVRIITPGIPDKKMIYQLTRSYYAQLLQSGVRIYEYTPGFIHAKQMLSDDTTAVVGTINLDYRSLYLHFENAVLLYRCNAIKDVRRDFEATFPLCRQLDQSYAASRPIHTRIVQSLLRLFAPLL